MLAQLPGLAVPRLLAAGYGFGGEGDWKTSALVRAMKVMGAGLTGGTTFMEDYTYHLDPAGNKVPDALLKLGMTEAQLGREHEARASFALLSQNYPSASAAQRIPQGYREP